MQLVLFDLSPTPLTCGNGSPWPCGPCEGCRAETARLLAEYEAGRLTGHWDAHGDTPADRRAVRRMT